MSLSRGVIVASILALSLAACSSKGKAGAKCKNAMDCARGYFCEADQCQAGPETSCAYLARCIPKMDLDQVQTLFGDDPRELVRQLEEDPMEGFCDGKLKILQMANRMVVLTRACGPQVKEGP